MNYSQIRRKVESQVKKAKDMPEFAKAFIQERMDRAAYFRQPCGVWTSQAKDHAYSKSMSEMLIAGDLLHAYEIRQ